MIGVVNATAAAGALVRGEVEASSTQQSFAANPDRLQVAPTTQSDVEQGAKLPQAGFVSPTVRMDDHAKIAVLEFRDSLTGDVLAQIPSKEQLRAYRIRQAKQDEAVSVDTMPENQKASVAKSEGRAEPEKVNTEIITPQDYAKFDSEVSA